MSRINIVTKLKHIFHRNRGSQKERSPKIKEVMAKVDSNEMLEVEDIKFILSHFNEFKDKEDGINDKIDSKLGFEAYKSIISDLNNLGVIDDIREDLIEPSIDPKGFEKIDAEGQKTRYKNNYVGKNASEYVGSIYPPNKEPEKLGRIKDAVLRYLFVVGKGFYFDPEMIYEPEKDYQELVETIVGLTDLSKDYHVRVQAEQNGSSTKLLIKLYSENKAYSKDIEVVGDWLNFGALKLIQEALEESSESLHYYAPTNHGWVLILDDDKSNEIKKYFEI